MQNSWISNQTHRELDKHDAKGLKFRIMYSLVSSLLPSFFIDFSYVLANDTTFMGNIFCKNHTENTKSCEKIVSDHGEMWPL